MGMSTRPCKRARQESIRKDINLVCHLQPLILQLTSIQSPFSNHAEQFEHILDNIGSLLANLNDLSHVCDESILKLHNILILHLGTLAPLEGKSLRLDKISAITFCLLLLNDTKHFRAIHELIDKEEVVEAYSTLIQVIKGLNQFMSLNDDKLRQSHINCFRLVEYMLLRNNDIKIYLKENRDRLEELIHSILLSDENIINRLVSIKGECCENILNILKNDSSFGSLSNRLAKIAQAATSEEIGNEMSLVFDSSSEQDLTFHFKCLAYRGQSSSCPKNAKLHLERLFISAKKDDLIGQNARECFCLLINRWDLSNTHSQLVEEVVTFILHKACSSEAGILDQKTLFCLNLLTQKDSIIEVMYCQGNEWGELKTLLERTAKGSSKDNIMATKILLSLIDFSQEKKKREESQDSSQSVIMESARLCSAESQDVVGMAVTYLGNNLQPQTHAEYSMTFYPDLVRGLSLAAVDDFASKITKREVMKLFLALASSDPRNSGILVRDSRALESIVGVASDRGPTESSRDLAISIMMQMSRNPCNHRILAKKQGALSSMIGYTRGLSRSEGDVDKVRVDMKKQIMLLADAL